MKNEINHTAHSSYRCEYHIVFAPKFRRKAIYGNLKKDIGIILRKLCKEMKVEIIEAEACPDHIHMLVSIPPYMSVAQFVGTLKSKSALMIFDRHANLKYRYGNRHFWCRGYFVDTVGKNEKKTSVYKGYKQDKIEMRGDRAEMSDFPLYLNMVAGGLDCRDQAIGGFSFVVKIYAVPVVEIIG